MVESFSHRIWAGSTLVRGGVCPECYGRVARSVDHHEDASLYTVANVCEGCGYAVHLPVEVSAAFHPAATAFLWRHGVCLPDMPLWEFFDLIAGAEWTTTVRSTDPFDARFCVVMGGETLRLAMDEAFEVAVIAAPDGLTGPDGPAGDGC